MRFARVFMVLGFWALCFNDFLVLYFLFETVGIISYAFLGLTSTNKQNITSTMNYFLIGFTATLFTQCAMLCFTVVDLKALGFILSMISFLMKLGIYPFNFWVSNFYEGLEKGAFLIFYTFISLCLIVVIIRMCTVLIETGWLENALSDVIKLKDDSWDNAKNFEIRIPNESLSVLDCATDIVFFVWLLVIYILCLIYYYMFYSFMYIISIWLTLGLAVISVKITMERSLTSIVGLYSSLNYNLLMVCYWAMWFSLIM